MNSCGYINPMVEALVLQQPVERDDPPAFRICGAENEPADTGLDHGSRAHDAGFQRDIQHGPREAVIADSRRRLTHGQHLGMSRWIMTGNRGIMGRRQNLPVTDQYGAHGHFTRLSAQFRLVKRQAHEPLVRFPFHDSMKNALHFVDQLPYT